MQLAPKIFSPAINPSRNHTAHRSPFADSSIGTFQPILLLTYLEAAAKRKQLKMERVGMQLMNFGERFGRLIPKMQMRRTNHRFSTFVVFVGFMLVAGNMAAQQSPTTGADAPKPSCSSVADGTNVFKILNNQTYALCAASSSFVFNKVAYTKCDVEFGDSIMLAFEFDDGQDVCTVNQEGVKNGYMVSTFSPPPSVREAGDQAFYTCPSGSDGAYAQCGGGICFKSTQKKSFPGFDEPLAKDEIICSCPITTQKPSDPVGYQIIGPYPCQQSFFDNCKKQTANDNTGSTLHVGAPTGTADLLTLLLTGSVPNENKCFMQPN